MAWQIVITTVAWIVFSLLEGFREAYYWLFKETSNYTKPVKDLHKYFATQRIIVGLIFSLFCAPKFDLSFIWFLNYSIYLISLGLVFVFLHDGQYYATRNDLDNTAYTKRWMDYSKESSALTERFLTPINRSIMLILGIGGIIYSIFA